MAIWEHIVVEDGYVYKFNINKEVSGMYFIYFLLIISILRTLILTVYSNLKSIHLYFDPVYLIIELFYRFNSMSV